MTRSSEGAVSGQEAGPESRLARLSSRLLGKSTHAARLAPWIRGVDDLTALVAQNVATTAIATITSLLNARGLGPSNLGLVSLTQTVVGLSVSLTTMGVSQTSLRYASREMAAGRTEAGLAVLRWSLRHRMVFLIVLNVILFAFAGVLANNLWHQPELTSLIRIALPIGLLATLATVPDIYYQSLRRFWVNTGVRIGEALVGLLGVLALWAFSWWTPFASVMVSTTATAAGAVLFLAVIPRRVMVDWPELKHFMRHPREALAFPKSAEENTGDLPAESATLFARSVMVSSLLYALSSRVDFVTLGRFRPASDVGLYSVAMAMALPVGFGASALVAALFPRMAAERTRRSLVVLLRRTVKICVVAFAAAALYAAIVPPLAPVFFGIRYSSSVHVAQLLCLHQAISIIAAPLNTIGFGFGLARQYVWVNVVQFAVICAVDVMLVPHLGPVGAAVGWIAADLTGLVASVLFLKRCVNTPATPAAAGAL